jgi:flavin reductase (DIM6/NTAB) family NADH-FMN oxidoreductase RutF
VLFKPFMREGMMPLPVTFISTISREGVRNIAPWSCVMPILRPLDLICAASAKKRDTLKNIRETGEFVLNLAGVNMQDRVIPTARHSAPEVDEFVEANLDEKPSHIIKAPGIAGCYGWMECELVKEFEEERYALIVGRVLRLEVADDVLKADGSLDIQKARPLLITGSKQGMHFCTLQDLGVSEPFSAMFPDGKDPFAEGVRGEAQGVRQ